MATDDHGGAHGSGHGKGASGRQSDARTQPRRMEPAGQAVVAGTGRRNDGEKRLESGDAATAAKTMREGG